MTPAATWVLLILLVVLTIRFLPFISLDADMRLRDWLREMQRKIERDEDNN